MKSFTYFFICFFIFSKATFAFEEVLQFSDDAEAILTHTVDYNGELNLDEDTSHRVHALALLQRDRDIISTTSLDKNPKKDCPPKESIENIQTQKDYNNPCGPRLPGGRKWGFGYYMHMPSHSYSDYGRKQKYDSLKFNSNNLNTIKNERMNLGRLSLDQAADYLKKKYHGQFGDMSNAEIIQEIAYDRLLNSNADQRDAILAEAGKHMSFQDQINFVAKAGNKFSQNYDGARAADAISAKGSIDCNALFDAQLSGVDAGVCRDMAVCQAAMLEKLSPENKGHAYAVSFASPGSYHVTTIATDPKTGTVHKINYDDVITEEEKQGIAALDQSHALPSVGAKFRMWDPEGKIVSELPEERYLMLNRVLGLNPKDEFDPLIREDYRLQSAYVNYGPMQGNVFIGRLSNGDQIMGTALNLKWAKCSGNQNSKVRIGTKGSFGLGYTNQSLTTENVDGVTTNDYSLHNVYAVLDGEVFMPIKASDNVTITPYIGGRFGTTVAITDDKISDDGIEITGDGDLVGEAGVLVEAKTKNDKHKVSAEVKTQLAPGLGDIRPLLGSNVLIYPNYTQAQLGYETAVTGTLEDPKLVLFTNTMLVLRKPGNHLMVVQGVRHSKETAATRHETEASVSLITPVGRLRQGWLPGGTGTTFGSKLQHSTAFKDREDGSDRVIFDLGLEYQHYTPPSESSTPDGHAGFIQTGIRF